MLTDFDPCSSTSSRVKNDTIYSIMINNEQIQGFFYGYWYTCALMQPWYFLFEGARHIFLGKGHLHVYEEFVNFYWNISKGTN